MKKASLFLLLFSLSFGSLAISTFAQKNVDLDKKWSKVQIDVNSSRTNTDYNYVPGPPVYRKYDMGETDVLVMPNYRILPSSASTQSELSIDIHPLNSSILFAGANATPNPVSGIYGTGVYWTTNAGTSWAGFDNPPFGGNSGDPAATIGTNGYFYMGYITNGGGMGVSKSTNNGALWTSSVTSSSTSDDKNHLMADKTVGSPYENRVYNTWTDFNNNNAVL